MVNFNLIINKDNDFYECTPYYGYIYVTILNNRDKYYIGQKKGTPKKTQNYFGSSKHLDNIFMKDCGFHSNNCPKDIAWSNAIDKIILDYALDEEELDEKEQFYIERAKIFQDYEGQCLNIHPGGHEGFKREKTVWNKGLTKETDERVANICKNRKKPILTEEQLQNKSNKMKLAVAKRGGVWNKGLTAENDKRLSGVKNRDTSYMKTKEWSEMISNLQKGKQWYNNGVINTKFSNKDIIPPDFEPGMIKGNRKYNKTENYNKSKQIKSEKLSKAFKNTKYYNNGKVQIRLKEGMRVPEGFKLGGLPKK